MNLQTWGMSECTSFPELNKVMMMGENLRSRGSLFAKTAAAAMAVVLAMGLASYSQAYAADAAEGQGGAILAAGIASADNAGATALSTQADEVTEGVAVNVDTGVSYQSLSKAIGAAKKGQTVKVLSDIEVTTRIALGIIAQPFTLDLNGHNLTFTNPSSTYRSFYVRSGVVTLANSAENQSTISFTTDDGFYLASGGLVVGKGVKLDAAGTHTPVLVMGKATLKIEDGAVVQSQDSFAVTGNGSSGKGGYTIDISGGVVKSENAPAIYLPNSGSTTISGGVITGSDAVYIKSGALNITGGEFVGTGEAREYSYNGNGTSSTGDALVVDNCGYPGGSPEVVVYGGTFKSVNAQPIASYATSNYDVLAGFVYGGSFSKAIDEQLPATGYELRNAEDGSEAPYSVQPKSFNIEVVAYNGAVAVPETARYGDIVTLTLTPDGLADSDNTNDFALYRVDVDEAEVEVEGAASFVMPAHDTTVTVWFYPTVFDIARDRADAIADKAEEDPASLTWDEIITAVYWYQVARDVTFTDDPGVADDPETIDVDESVPGVLSSMKTGAIAAVESSFGRIVELDMSGKNTSENGYDISTGALQYFTNLRKLNLSSTGISEFGGLAPLVNLTDLDLSCNVGVTNNLYGALVNMAQLKSINLSETSITDIGGLAGTATASSIEAIDVSKDRIPKFESVWNATASAPAFPSLKTLKAQDIEVIESLSGLVELTRVSNFDTTGLLWDFGNGWMNDYDNQVKTIESAFIRNSGTGRFVPPNVADYLLNVSPARIEATLETPDATLQALLTPEGTPGFTLAWSSANSEVAAVDENGKVSFVAPGETVITCVASDGRGHEATGRCTVVVSKIPVSDFKVEMDGWTYGTDPKTPSVSGNASEGSVSYLYAPRGTESYTSSVPTEAGLYTVKATVEETERYESASATCDFEIAKADFTPTVSIEGWTYGGAANAPSLSGNTGNGAVTYTYAVKGSDELSTDVPANAGDYTVKAEIAATANYNGAVATADFTIAKAAITPTVSIAGWTYGEVANLPAVEGNTGNGRVTYEYTNKATESSSAYLPQVAGNFTLKATVAETDNYLGGEATVDFTVAKAPISNIVPPTAKTGLVYTGQVQALITRGSATGGVMEYSTKSDPNSFSSAIPTGTDVGRYPIYYRVVGDSNHESTGVFGLDSSDRITAVIEAVPSSLYVLPTAIDIDYDGQPHSLLASGGRAMNGTVMYSLKAGTGYSTEFPEAADAGVYRVYYMVKADPNYADTEPQYVSARIRTIPAEADPVPAGAQLTYNGHVQTLIDPSTVEGNANKILFSLDGNNFDVRYPNATNAGDYEVRYKVIASDSNHHDSDPVGFVVTIEKGTAFPEVYLANWAYGQTAATPIMSGVEENAEVTFEYAPAKTENYSAELPTDAGKYTVRATVAETANYKSAVATDSFTIFTSAATVDVAPAAIEGLVYNGLSQALVAAGESDSGTMQYSLDGTNWSTDIPTGVNSGSYTVYFRVLGDSNHSDSGVGSVSVIVAPAEVDAIAPVAKALTYTGEEQALVEPGASDKGTVEYSLDGEEWSTEVPTATNAGNYPVMWRVIGGENYDSTDVRTINVSIARAETAEPTAPVAVANLAYNGQEQALVVPAVDEGREVLYSLDGEEWSTEVPTATDAGSYTVFAKVAGDANHNDSPIVSTDVTVAKASISPIATMTGWTYGDGSNTPRVVGDPGNGNKTYTYAPAGSSDYTSTVPTDAGDYTVRVQIAETANYEGAVAAADFTIARANATVTANNAFKYEGADDPALTATITGLAAGESSSQISYTLRRASGEAVATYNITASGETVQGNYNVSFVGGTFSIIERPADSTPTPTPSQGNTGDNGSSGNMDNGSGSGSNSGSNSSDSGSGGAAGGDVDDSGNGTTDNGSSTDSGSSSGADTTPSNSGANTNSGSNGSSSNAGNADSGSSSNAGTSNASGGSSNAASNPTNSNTSNGTSNASGAGASGAPDAPSTAGTSGGNDAAGTATPAGGYTPTYVPTATYYDASTPAAATTPATTDNAAADDGEEASEPARTTGTATTTNNQSTNNQSTTNQSTTNRQNISDDSNPLSSRTEAIEDDANALAESATSGGWSLFDLGAAIVSVLAAAGLVVLTALRKNKGLSPKDMVLAGSGLAVAVAALATVLVTQNFTQPMVAFDAWSGLEAAFVVAEAVIVGIAAATGKSSKTETA